LEPEAKVLELAGGNCNLAAHLKTHYTNILVSDSSIEMIKKFIDPGLNKVCCDMTQLPF